MHKVALKECGETEIVCRFFSYTHLINLHRLKLYDMQGNEKFLKYQCINEIAFQGQSQSKILII